MRHHRVCFKGSGAAWECAVQLCHANRPAEPHIHIQPAIQQGVVGP